MNYKRKSNKRRIGRKMFTPTKSLKEWSRMLHGWWKKDLLAKKAFKKKKYDY